MNNLSFLHPLSLALLSYIHIYIRFSQLLIEDSTNLLVYTQQIQILMQQIIPLLQISYAILSESVFVSESLEPSLTNFMNTLIQVSKSL